MDNNLHKISVDDLPPSLRELVEIIGLPATLKFIECYGGLIRLYIPRELRAGNVLAKDIGITAARKLIARYGGEDIYNIPNCKRALCAVRDREIVDRFNHGNTATALMRDYNLTERYIWYILARYRVEPNNQTSIFDPAP